MDKSGSASFVQMFFYMIFALGPQFAKSATAVAYRYHNTGKMKQM